MNSVHQNDHNDFFDGQPNVIAWNQMVRDITHSLYDERLSDAEFRIRLKNYLIVRGFVWR